MRYYESFDNYKIDPSLIGEEVYAFNKYDGQNFVAKLNVRKKTFDLFGTRKRLVDETDENYKKAIELFKKEESELLKIVKENPKIFSEKEAEFYFEFVGENSFCGMHKEGDKMHLVLIDIWIHKKGYIEPKEFCKITEGKNIEVAEVVYKGKLTKDFIKEIETNIETNKYPIVKEGVVCKKTTKLKGQRLPKCKVKTLWWLEKVKEKYPNDWEERI